MFIMQSDWAEEARNGARDPVAFGKEQERSHEGYFQEPHGRI